ncbi:unnamed protein product [Parnassius apollo]|uniref:(apollo) hypothetical protein n=1 Tax=Parnassius apollo TaxID=110799 RepID=A0A8S3Y8P6_PARAO|nr:unnamed protein product [Parnassius apollo]
MQGRPLCLYYFTHPFGVLSPEPPRVTAFVPEDAGAPGGVDVVSVPGGVDVVSVPGGVDVVSVPGGCTLQLGELSACSWFSAMLSRDMWGDVGRTAGGRLLPPLRFARAPPAPGEHELYNL